MIDIEQIRKNPVAFKSAIAAKRIKLDIERLLQVDEERRMLGKAVNQLREQRNRITDLVTSDGQNRASHIAHSKEIGAALALKESQLKAVDLEYHGLMAHVPGLPAAAVPVGADDSDNVEIYRVAEVAKRTFKERDHIELALLNRMVDFEGARFAAGSRAYGLIGDGALLELAVLRFALDHVLAKGFTAVLPPLMVNEAAMFGTGYFPLGEDNAYQLEEGKRYLTGTSEVGIVAMQANRVVAGTTLRFAGISTCFRREAGAAGRDTKGLYRVHQFQKVEQVVFCANDVEVSEQEHLRLLKNSEEIVQALELPYRVVAVCTGDMGLGQVRKHDIETWMPSRGAYCETHSCSTFHDFQARRLGIRYIDHEGKKQYVHTLNNTAIASPRILIALLENHQNQDGTINVPKALRPYLGGREVLGG
ncbi:MAG: serine--tRNA ligase [Candidatus Melainabacteria bacterium]|nr:serine--tRNA ligase [Candidatus Melainabacteria bacterium]